MFILKESNDMERKIGETSEFEGKTYKVVKFNGCTNCAFYYNYCPNLTPVIGNCIDYQRSDGAKVMFEETKGNKLTINIPEGMEIDLQNSNFDTGVFYFKKKQPEFKDGDIIKMTWDKYSAIAIFWEYSNFGKGFDSHVFFNINTKIIEYNIHGHTLQDMILRLATEEEKQQFFDTLAKEGKVWDAEKKEVVDLKPKWTPKPFDKIVAFRELYEEWVCDMFSHYSKNYEDKEIIVTIGGCTYFKALPFNEETAKLIGTKNNMEG